jgi:beta-galactosidase
MDRILAAACAEAGVATEPLPPGLRRRDAGGVRFWFNYGAEPVTHAGRTLHPAGVLWEPI